MSGFEALELPWQGRTPTIAANRMMGALQLYERAVGTQDFLALCREGMGAAPAVFSAAYAGLLRYAGERVSDEEVYRACLAESWVGVQSVAIADKLLHLQMLRLPPERRAQIEAASAEAEEKLEGEAGEEAEPENPTPAAQAS